MKFALPDTNVISEEADPTLSATLLSRWVVKRFFELVCRLCRRRHRPLCMFGILATNLLPLSADRDSSYFFDLTGTSTVTLELRTGGGYAEDIEQGNFCV